MAIEFVQAASIGTQGVGDTSLDLTVTAVGEGNMIAGVVTWGSGTTSDLTSVTDNDGNSYTIQRRIADTTNGQSAASFFCQNVTGGPVTITANFGASVPYRGLSVHEYSGQNSSGALDGSNEQGRLQTAPGTGTDGASSGTGNLTPSVNNCLVWGGGANTGALGNGVSEFAAGTNFTEPANSEVIGGSFISLSSEYEIQTTAAARNASFTVVDTAHITLMMVFKPAGAVTPALDDGVWQPQEQQTNPLTVSVW